MPGQSPAQPIAGQAKLDAAQVDEPYFAYYSSLQNQANMLSDVIRTTGYRKAIVGNSVPSFAGKTVMDVGAGNGILSFFAVEAGASLVYACEASNMALKLQMIVDEADRGGANAHLKDKILVVKGKIEDYVGPKVDTLVSEPIGVLLVHERMIESYIHARDHFLKPGGAMYPSAGVIHLAPFSDEALYLETLAKGAFFDQGELYGVDLSVLSASATEEVFQQPVVGLFAPGLLTASATAQHVLDFTTVSAEDLKSFTIPIDWLIERTSLLHGIASWFDINFDPPSTPDDPPDQFAAAAWDAAIWAAPPSAAAARAAAGAGTGDGLGATMFPPPPPGGVSTTIPTGPKDGRTHWQQARLLLSEPLAVNAGEVVQGFLDFKVNDQRSYDLTAELWIARPGVAGALDDDPLLRRSGKYALHLQTFNYAYTG